MIHPDTELKYISELLGYGVFATKDIPEGTIVYVKDSMEILVSQVDFLIQSKPMQEAIEKYSYIDELGNRIVSWDFAKYVNHCCNCNTISTGYGFEIAIRNIHAGEQITDEYGLFNIENEMELSCTESCCRKKLTPMDFDLYYKDWDEKVKISLKKLFDVDQPLFSLLDDHTFGALKKFVQNNRHYRSVYHLKYHKETKLNGLKKSKILKN
jgi:hypothetical protein